MELTVIDAPKLRVVQAATAGAWKPGTSLVPHHHVIRAEPSGRAVGTNEIAFACCENVFAPFEGEPKFFVMQGTLPKTASSATISGDTLTTNKGDKLELAFPALSRPYYPYIEHLLTRLSEGTTYPYATYGFDAKQLHTLVSAHPKWPKETYFKLRHLSKNSVQIDFGDPEIIVLLQLAGERS